MSRPLIVSALFILLAATAGARPRSLPDRTITAFRLFTTREGLPSNYVHCLTLDPHGFLWIGTLGGIARFDGTSFNNLNIRPGDLPSPSVSFIRPMGDSLMLISTGSGLAVYNLHKNRFENGRITDAEIRAGSGAIVFDAAPLASGGVLVSASKSLKVLDHRLRVVRSLPRDAQTTTTCWIKPGITLRGMKSTDMVGDVGTLKIFDTERMQFRDPGAPYDAAARSIAYVTTVAQDSAGVFLSGWHTGVYYLNETTGQLDTISPSPPPFSANYSSDRVVPIPGKPGSYIATLHNGLLRYDRTASTVERLIFSRSGTVSTPLNICKDVVFDHEGNLWAATENGLVFLSANADAFTSYELPLPAPFPFADAYVDSARRLWLLTYGGDIQRLHEDGRFVKRYVRSDYRVPPDHWTHLNHMIREADGRLYLATAGGLFWYDASCDCFRLDERLHNSPFNGHGCAAFLKDSRGVWWISFTGGAGLVRADFRTGDLRYYDRSHTTPDSSLYLPMHSAGVMIEDGNGDVWMGLNHGAGKLLRWHGGGMKPQVVPILVAGVTVQEAQNALAAGRDGRLWVATNQYGVMCREADGAWTQYDVQRGLKSNFITGLAMDYAGNLWASTNNGLSVLRNGARHFLTYTEVDGLPFEVLNNLCFPDSRAPHRLFILADGKVATVDTRMLLRHSRSSPSVHILGLEVENAPHDATVSGRFKHWQSHFQIHYSAVQLSGGDVQYAYRIEGLDRTWTETRQRRVTFANIPPGSYTFAVRARDGDGAWSEPARYSFIIAAPFWKRWWFYALCALAVAAGVYGIYRYQLSKAIALHQVRNRISRDLHDEVGSTLSSISLMNEMAARNPDAQGLQQKIGDSIQKAQGAMSDIVWMINPTNDRMSNLVLRFGEVAAELLEPRGIQYSFSTTGLDGAKLPMEARRELYLIYKEALNNIVKYADATEVSITLREEAKHLFMRVADNGRGFDANRMTSGNGLHNIAERAKASGGAASIHTTIGAGTTVEVELPRG